MGWFIFFSEVDFLFKCIMYSIYVFSFVHCITADWKQTVAICSSQTYELDEIIIGLSGDAEWYPVTL